MKYFFLLLLLFGSGSMLVGQELATANYGLESALKTNKIYDLYYAKNELLYICTDNGLWSYNGLSFKKHPLKSKQSLGLTDVQEDGKGQLFVRDFRGHIYQLNKEGELELYPLSSIVKGKILGFRIVGNNKYFYTNRTIYSELNNGQWVKVFKDKSANIVIGISRNGIAEVRYNHGGRKLHKLVDSTLIAFPTKHPILHNKFDKQYQDSWCNISEDQKIVDSKGNMLVNLSLAPVHLEPVGIKNIQGNILVACRNGLYYATTKQLFFEGEYITGIEEDREGNIWIGTLNGGIYKIHHISCQVYPISNIKEGADFIFVHNNQVIYSDLMGNLYRYNFSQRGFESFYSNALQATTKNIFFHSPTQYYMSSGNEFNVFDSSFQLVYHAESYGKIAPMQNSSKLFQTRLARATYFNLSWNSPKGSYSADEKTGEKLIQTTPWREEKSKAKIGYLSNGVKFFLSDNPEIRLTAIWGEHIVYCLGDKLHFLNWKTFEQQIIGGHAKLQELWVENNQLFVVDSTDFLELDKKGQILHKMPLTNGMEQGITHLSANDQYICLSNKIAIHVINTKDFSYQHQFSTQNGIASVDFVKGWVYGHYLYVNGSKGITKIDLEANYNKGNPLLELATVTIDSQEQVGHNFEHDQNNIELNFDVKSFTAQGRVHWRINGKNWRELPESKRLILSDLQSGSYVIEAVFKNDLGANSNFLTYSFYIDKPYWQKPWFWLVIIGLVVGLFWWWYQRRLQQIQAKNDLENKLIASQMTALKSQMNPHFIFNALNSIQSLVRFNKNKEAYKYINKFAVLLRETLYYSDKDAIPLEREISMLHNYLDMEKMRLDGELDFSIEANCSTDISIPSMIIQPFVENAIKHGLLHKVNGQKKLQVTFEEKNQGSIVCTVLDNGIGRERASKIVAQQKRMGTSFSTAATQKRLELLQELNQNQLGVSYTDLYDNNKQPLGTKVELIIPVDF